MSSKSIKILLGFFLVLIAVFALVSHLGSNPLFIWDESLFAMRAMHIAEYGKVLPNFNAFDNMPNHINTKLPFTTLFQVFAMKVFGYGILSIRLPITFIILSMMGLSSYWLDKNGFSKYISYLFVFILSTSLGWLDSHIARGGNHDAAFASYLTLSIFAFYFYLENESKKKKYIYLTWFSFFMIAALLTKNVLALGIAPGLLMYTIFSKKLKSILSSWSFYIAIVSILGIFGGVLLYLNFQNPGLINRIWNYELLGRYTNVIEAHKGSTYFYLELMLKWFSPWLFFVPISWIMLFSKKINPSLKNLSWIFNFTAIIYLIILSTSKTKTHWYAAPLYPFFSVLAAIGLYVLIDFVNNKFHASKMKYVFYIAFGVLLIIPLKNMIEKVTVNEKTHKTERLARVLKHVEKTRPELKKMVLADMQFGTASGYYIEVYNRTKNYNLRFERDNRFNDNEYVILCTNQVFDVVKKEYKYDVLWHDYQCHFIKILSKK